MTLLEPTPTASFDRPSWLPPAEWPFEPRAVELDGHRLHLIDAGQGPAVLFVHAGMWSFVWRDVILRLSDAFRCVALDFPGSGLSEAPAGHVPSLASNSAVLERVVDDLGLADLTLVVHDLGGPIGLGLAARRPQLVRALVATQTFGWPPQRRVLRAMLGLMGSAPMRGFNTTTNLVPRITATSFGVGRHLDSTSRRAFLGPLRDRRRRATFHRLMADTRRADDLLGAIELALASSLRDRPLLTIFGERNDPLGFQERWKELFPAARQVVVPGGNHFPMNDDPDLFAAALRSWWGNQVSRDGRPA